MRNLLLVLLGYQLHAQVLQPEDRSIITQSVQQGLEAEAARIAALKVAAYGLAPVKAVSLKLDTIVSHAQYVLIQNRYINNVDIKNGVYYFNFIGDVPVGITDNGTITNATTTYAGVARQIAPGMRRRLVYAELADPAVPEVILEREFAVGLMSVPFKIRGRSNTIPSESKADIKNLCLTVGHIWTRDKYYYTGKKVRFRWGPVALIGGSVESLGAKNTRGLVDDADATNQIYLTLSTGLLITAFDKINFAILPIGGDIGFSDSSKKWIYNGKYWWGFGIGIDTSLFYFTSKRKSD